MKPPKPHRIIPSIIMVGTSAVPVVTSAYILTHIPGNGAGVASSPSMPAPAGRVSTSGTGRPSGGGSYTGSPFNEPYGPVQATVTIGRGRITDVAISAPQSDPRSASINQQAVPLLRQETLQAQSAHINLISGATLTSQAYIQSLQSALAQARQGSKIAGSGNAVPAIGQASVGAPQLSVSGGGDD